MKKPIILSIGEILFDVYPDKAFIGGAPFNFIFHLHQLGFPTQFLSRIGRDKESRAILDFLKKYKMSDDFIQIDPIHTTGKVEVTPSESGNPAFIVLTNRAYDYIEYPFGGFSPQASLIYFGTLAQRGDATRKTIAKLVKNKVDKSLVFLDLNLRAPFYNGEVLDESLTHCDILKLNSEELKIFRSYKGEWPEDEKECIHEIMKKYQIKWVALTKGHEGSSLYSQMEVVSHNYSEQVPMQDTLGAGDGYAAVLAAGILKGWSAQTIVERATQFAEGICKVNGALPEPNDFYLEYRKWFES